MTAFRFSGRSQPNLKAVREELSGLVELHVEGPHTIRRLKTVAHKSRDIVPLGSNKVASISVAIPVSRRNLRVVRGEHHLQFGDPISRGQGAERSDRASGHQATQTLNFLLGKGSINYRGWAIVVGTRPSSDLGNDRVSGQNCGNPFFVRW